MLIHSIPSSDRPGSQARGVTQSGHAAGENPGRITSLVILIAIATIIPACTLFAAIAMVNDSRVQVALGVLGALSIALGMTSAWAFLQRDRQMRQLAVRDSMTGLFNHGYFIESMRQMLAQSQRSGEPATVMMVDVDRFKEINDTLGHQAGDEVLCMVGEHLARTVREYDTVCRYGGEEFGIVLPGVSDEGAHVVAERLRKSIASGTFPIQSGLTVTPTVSIGFAVFPEDATSVEDLIRLADRALYMCKYYGRNQLRRAGESDMSQLGAEEHRELIEALAMVVDLRDGTTAEHNREVAGWARLLAHEMGFDPFQVNMIETAALLHDVGKVGVPDAILEKPSRLDEHEWGIMREHPGWGESIVGRVSSLREIAELVGQHQEWFDGTGYPRGLAEADIELGARIISVVDAFHAIISDRPYRKAQSHDHALNELRRMAGYQFDPTVVNAFVELIQRGAIDTAAIEGRMDEDAAAAA